jgi:hypothetical protein
MERKASSVGGRSRLFAAAVAVAALAGCHLVFPFGVTAPGAGDAGADGPRPADGPVADGPASDIVLQETGKDPDGAPVPDAGKKLVAWVTPSNGTGALHQCYPSDLALDSSGNSYVTGGFKGLLNLGSGMMANNGKLDVFVAKLDPGGKLVWSSSFGGAGDDGGIRLAVDSSGVYVTGYVTNTITFNNKADSGSTGMDGFVARLGLDGSQQWIVRAWGSGTNSGMGLAVDPSGVVHVTGKFEGKVHLGSPYVLAKGGSDGFYGTIGPGGAVSVLKALGGTSSDSGIAVGISSKFPIVVGTFTTKMVLGTSILTTTGVGEDAFACQFTAGGFVKLLQLGGAGADIAADIAVGAADELHLAGQLTGLVDPGGGNIGKAGIKNGFVVKRKAGGQHAWARATDAAGEAGFYTVALGPKGQVLAAGYHVGTVKLGTAQHAEQGQGAALLVSHDGSTGNPTWSRSYGGPGVDRAVAVAVHQTSGDVWLLGSFQQTVILEGTTLSSSPTGSTDLFLLRMKPPVP